MKKNSLSMVMCYIISILFVSISSIHLLYSQSIPDLSREILIYIQPSELIFPSVERGMLTPNSLSIHSKALEQAFTRFKVRSVSKAFPNFSDADTLRIMKDGRKISVPQLSRIFRLQIQEQGDIDSAIMLLSKIPGVLFAEKNLKAQLYYDPTYGNQWHLNNTGQSGGTVGVDIKAEDAWSIFTGSSSVKIGIIDCGVEINHEDLNGKATGDVDDINDDIYHGTHVAGIAAAKVNNNLGGRGVDWNAQILSKRIFSNDYVGTGNSNGYIGDANAAGKVIDAVNEGANVLNNSWGGGGATSSATLRNAFAYAYKMNCVSVVAMGNDYNNGNPTSLPAAFGPGIIAVGSTTDQDIRSFFSQTGNHIDVVAPGGTNLTNFNQHDIWSAWGGSTYHYYTGTSMATPVVSGIASLLKGYNSNLYNDDIEHIIQLSTDKVSGMSGQNYTTDYGYGRVNARKALNMLRAPITLTHASTTGGIDQGPSNSYIIPVYGAQYCGLADGYYRVKAHTVLKTVTFPANSWRAVWGRGVASTGWVYDGNSNFSMGFCDVVPGTVTSTSAQVRTYVYEVWTILNESLGWKPTSPGSVTFAYTIITVPTTITTNSTLDGNYILDNSVTVNSGVTLTVTPGSVISFTNGASLTVNGVLNANGTSSSPITFTSASGTTAGSWGSININGSGSSGSNLNYVNMQYGTEINITNTTNVTIQNSTIQNCTNGIVGSTATASVLNNKITNVTNHGISLANCTFTCSQNVIKKTSDFAYYHTGFGILYNSGSSGTVWQNDIRGFGQGVGALWGSSPTSFGSYSIPKNNRITNCLIGLRVYAQSYPIFGTNPPSNYMWNSIYSNTKNVEVGVQYPSYGNGLLAYGNWWGNNPPNTSLFSVGANSWFYYNPYRTSDPWSGIPLPSVIATSNPSNEVIVLQKVSIDNQNINQSNSTDLTNPLLNGIELRYQNKYKEAKDYFLSYLSKYPENQAAYIELYNCYNEETAQEIIDYFNAPPTQASNVHKLLLSNLYLKQGSIDKAKKVNNDIIHGNPNTPLAARAKLNNIYIALNNDNDYNNAISMFTDILKGPKYSLDIDLSLTEELIETYALTHGKDKPRFNTQGRADVLSLTTTDISNFPNPFNPSTVINYQLPEQGHVSIKVYDLLGREVATLVDEVKETGRYSVNFDGSRLSSGVYFIRMNIQPQEGAAIVQVKKMLLTK